MAETIDKRTARRRRALLVGAIILMTIIVGTMTVLSDATPGAWRTIDIVRVCAFLFHAHVLGLRSTTAFSLLGRNAVLDDELTRANRATAARTGFWVLLLAAMACFAAIVFGLEMSAAEALLAVIAAGAIAAAIRFSMVERRGDG
jgi:hypothetical protein